jgi:hypothetical protein
MRMAGIQWWKTQRTQSKNPIARGRKVHEQLGRTIENRQPILGAYDANTHYSEVGAEFRP